MLDTNLVGTINCLEAARARGAAFLFLSTSRIYPIAPLNALPFVEDETRFRWQDAAGDRPASRHTGSPRTSRWPGRGRSTGRASWRANS